MIKCPICFGKLWTTGAQEELTCVRCNQLENDAYCTEDEVQEAISAVVNKNGTKTTRPVFYD
jgi:hypothetical protein